MPGGEQKPVRRLFECMQGGEPIIVTPWNVAEHERSSTDPFRAAGRGSGFDPGLRFLNQPVASPMASVEAAYATIEALERSMNEMRRMRSVVNGLVFAVSALAMTLVVFNFPEWFR